MKTFLHFMGIIALLLPNYFALAQSSQCAGADPFCIVNVPGPDASFPASTGAGSAELGNNYGCLGTQPNPAWYFVEMATAGAINIQMSTLPVRDIDFAMWGPFPSATAAINSCGSLGTPLDCSYSTASIEIANIPASSQAGQVYIMVITNFSNQPATINVEDITGTVGTTTCDTSNPCGQVDASPGSNSPVCTGETLNLFGNDLVFDALETYQWTGPAGFSSTQQNPTIPNVTSANSGNYTLVVTSSNGCISSPVSINVFAGQPTVNVNGTANVCPDGTITLIANTLVPPSASLVYNWTGPNGFTYSSSQFNNAQIPNATAANDGVYTCQIVANGTCASPPDDFTVNVVDIQPNAIVLNPSCGTNNGSISLAPSGGGATYTYAWTPPAAPSNNVPNRTNLSAGTYTVTITSSGCTTTTTYNLINAGNLSVQASGNPPACAGANTGNATVAVPAGSYTYTWSTNPTQNTQTTNSTLAAGNYTVTVSNLSGTCTGTSSVVLAAPTPIAIASSSTAPTCAGSASGSASVVASNGSSPTYTYAWSNGQSTATTTNLTAGNYTVTVTNAGCSATALVNVPAGVPFTASIAPPAALCAGNTNGTATVTTNGATPTGYTWNTAPAQNTATATNLSAGITYTVTVTAANNCSATASVNIPNSQLAVSINPTNPNCNGGNGSATANATNGAAPLSYAWNSTPAQNTATATALPAATYTVTVTDGNGCTATASVTLSQPTALSASIINSSNPTCNGGNNASATVGATGGTTPYNYAWNSTPAQNTATATNITAGNFTVTVTDGNGCTATADVFIDQNPAVTASVAPPTNATCNGGNNGSASVTAGGGTSGSYTYVWNTVPPQNTATAANLAAGTYTVTVTDDVACTVTATALVAQPSAVSGTTTNIPPTCAAGGNGSATVTPSGGSGVAYTFAWNTNPAQSTATANNLAGNATYTVTITDNAGCTGTASTTLSEPTALLVSLSFNAATCGQANGFATASVSNGTPPYSYIWQNNSSTTNQAIGYLAGSYQVTVSDNNGCSVVTDFVISNNGAPQATIISQVNATCGQNNGSVSFDVTDGTPPYSYTWAGFPSNITPSLNNVPAGQYNFTVEDANNCANVYVVTITDSPAITATATNISAATCGQANGEASISVSGGTMPFDYQWSAGGATTASSSTLAAGNYTVTVSDNDGCSETVTFSITQSAAISIGVPTVTNASCGAATGSINLSATGGNGLYSYVWQPNVGISGVLNNLAAGTYQVTVSDTDGCSATASATVGSNGSPNISISNSSNPSCGLANGAISVSANGGSGAGYAYTWFPNVSNGSSAANLAAGTYTITVTDSNNCSATTSATLSNASGPTLAAPTTTQPSCGNNNGSISFAALAGVTYAWSPNVSSSNNANNLGAGTYTLTVTDSNGCTDTEQVSLNNSTPPSISVSSTTNESCGNANGSISISVTNGTGVIGYTWTGSSSTSPTASNLTAGTYTVSVSDSNGCTDTQAVTLTNSAAPNLTINTNTAANCGQSNGSLVTGVTGGTGVLTYTWSPNVANGASAINIAAGNYTVTVTDASGCTDTAQASVADNAGVTLALVTQTNTTCGNDNGQIVTAANGGATPYNYTWSHDLQLNDESALNLAAGNYGVTVTDGNGCSSEQAVVLTDAAPPTLSQGSVTDASCNASNGSATAVGAGGLAPLTYAWNTVPAQNTATATNLAAGSYIVTVTDGNTCTATLAVAIGNVGAPTIVVNSVNDATCTAANGSISITASGGTGALSYAWNNGVTDTDNSVSNLLPNTYAVTVSDATGCQQVETITVGDTPPPNLQLTTILPDNCNQSSGFATVSGTDGLAPYSYAWNTVPPQNTASANNLAAGTYIVSVTDANTCTNTLSVTIVSGGSPTLSVVGQPTDAACGQANGSATVQANGGAGGFTYDWSPTLANDNAASLNILPAASYIVTVTDANGCSATASLTVNNSNGPVVDNATVTAASCGQSNGSISVSISGGSIPYTYAWSNNAANNTPTNSNLAPGNYIVTITDANACSITVSEDIVLLASPTISVASSTPETCGLGNGAIDITITNAGANHSIAWNNGATTEDIGNLTCTNYAVTVTDANGCSTTQSVTLACEGGITAVDGSVQNPSCGLNNGSITVSATGVGLSYTWTNGLPNTSNPTNLAAGSYTVTISDASNCEQIAEFELIPSTALSLAEQSVTNANCGQTNGSASVTVANATNPVDYVWSTVLVQNTATASNLGTGVYTVTATDANGCTATLSITVSNADGPTAVSTNGSAACATAEGSVSVAVNGGATPYSYAWSSNPIQNNDTATNLIPGVYTVTVTDNNACTATATATVVGGMPPTVVSCGIASINSLSFDWTAVSGAVSYSVSVDGGAAQNVGDTTSFTINGLSEGQSVSLSVVANGDASCGSSAPATQSCTTGVTICEPIAFVTDFATSLCSTDAAIDLNITPAGGSWSGGGVSSNQFSPANTVAVSSLLTYNYTIGACSYDTTVTINMVQLNVDIEAPASVGVGESVDLSAVLSGGTAVSYAWQPASVVCVASDCSTATDQATANTLYSIVVTDANGCTAAAQQNVAVIPIANAVVIPNAFSPNQDNHNDFFRVQGNNLQSVNMALYDRWGQLVYEQSGDALIGWNGERDSKNAEIGVYVYYIIVTYTDGKTDTHKGNLTLVR